MNVYKIQINENACILYLNDQPSAMHLEEITYKDYERLIFDVNDVEHISLNEIYALLGVSLAAKKSNIQVELRGVSPFILNILRDMKAQDLIYTENKLEPIDIKKAKLIAHGVCGEIYRISDDKILKLYRPNLDYEMISKEKKYAREALILGFPTAISDKLVTYENRIGIVFEMLKAESFSTTIQNDVKNIKKYATIFAQLAKTIHTIKVPQGKLPNRLKEQIKLFERQKFLTNEENEKVRNIISTLPKEINTCIHGDYHPGNIMLTGKNELQFVDMGDLAIAHPYEDIAQTFLATVSGYTKEEILRHVIDVGPKERELFFNTFLDEYLDHPDKKVFEHEFNQVKKYALMRKFYHIENFASTREFNIQVVRRLIQEIK